MSSPRPPLPFSPVRRNAPPPPVPYLFNEDKAPDHQRILVFLPHSDDGRFFGGLLQVLNQDEFKNEIRIVVVSPGWRGVSGTASREEKASVRWREALTWGQILGFRDDQMHAFRADNTYLYEADPDPDEQARMNELVATFKPTMVFVPHICDCAQYINYNTRAMVLHSLISWYADRIDDQPEDLLFLEYPTNHVPRLPPSDKNFCIAFKDLKLTDNRNDANKAHHSQGSFSYTVMMIEGAGAICERDYWLHRLARLGGMAKVYPHFSIQDCNPLRIEQFGLTMFSIREQNAVKTLMELRPEFPSLEKFTQLLHRG